MTKHKSAKAVQARYGIGASTMYRWLNNQEIGFPKPMKIGHRVLWREADLAAFDERHSNN
ncbi:helix-turn-helix domain-containing protein [uncultured Tateyamaria sp.]|uniref:helix-turn-helix transcriptional regulator n=1 Tax=uncultured Tateyamaria sp. TaxID=455651 RepID=UPI00260E35FB|nr:helix-turn-helix domain-containing protein [uncultured Tateyamaria sp.]